MPTPTPRRSRRLKKTAELAHEILLLPRQRLFFFDEGRFGMHTEHGRLWALRGIRPIAPTRIGYENFYIYGAVSPVDGEGFALFLPWVNTEMMNLYLEQFAKTYPQDEITLIMDRAGWHRSAALRVPANIHPLLLPAYSPELNPAEKLWQWLRRHVTRNRLFNSDEELEEALANAWSTQTNLQRQALCQCKYLYGFN